MQYHLEILVSFKLFRSFCKLFAYFLRNTGGRVIGGDLAAVGQFPYQAALYIQISPYDVVFCGGSLITTSHILTAGHCTAP